MVRLPCVCHVDGGAGDTDLARVAAPMDGGRRLHLLARRAKPARRLRTRLERGRAGGDLHQSALGRVPDGQWGDRPDGSPRMDRRPAGPALFCRRVARGRARSTAAGPCPATDWSRVAPGRPGRGGSPSVLGLRNLRPGNRPRPRVARHLLLWAFPSLLRARWGRRGSRGGRTSALGLAEHGASRHQC